MTELRLTHAAMKALYASPCSLVVAEVIAKKYRSAVSRTVDMLVLYASGIIAVENETLSDAALIVPFIGMPAGLLGIVVPAAQQDQGESLAAYAEIHAPMIMPEVLVLQGFSKGESITSFINDLLAKRVHADIKTLSRTQQQLAVLRADYEKSKMMLEKSARMMRGIGYGTRAIVYDLPVGDQLEGPVPGSSQHAYCQELPIDLIGLSGISLYVNSIAEGVDNKGELLLVIRSAADKKTVFSCLTSFDVFRSGWHLFAMPEPLTALGGEGELYLSWSGLGGPQFAKTSLTPDRFGDDEGTALAMRVEKGLAQIKSSPAESIDTFSGSQLVPVGFGASDLFSRGLFYGGSSLEAEINARNGWPVLTADDQQGWLQTHLLVDALSAFHVPSAFGVGATRASISVRLDHAKASPCVVMLVAADPDAANADQTRTLLAGLGVNEALHATDRQNGITWSVAVLHAEEQVHLQLELTSDDTQDLILVAKPLQAGKADFGWCRWQELTVSYALDEKIPTVSSSPASDDMMHRMRVATFPEIADRVSFYRGRYLHNKLRLDLGFMPVQMHNEFSAMQTNPLKDGICAAELVGGLPDDAVRIACEVGTAHAQGARFTYIMGVVPQGDKDRSETIDTIVQSVADDTPTGEHAGAVWSSVTLPALAKQQLALDLPPSIKAGDIPFFCAIPASGDTSFGWCRWYSLAIETHASSDGMQTAFEPQTT